MRGFGSRLGMAWFAGVCAAALWAPAQEPESVRSAGERIAEAAGIACGTCCVIDPRDSGAALDLARHGGLFVHALTASGAGASALRGAAVEVGLGLDRFVAEALPLQGLPHASNLLDLVVLVDPTEGMLKALKAQEALRVVRPRGKLAVMTTATTESGIAISLVQSWIAAGGGAPFRMVAEKEGLWLETTKPEREGVDNWSHWEHGPDNNPVSTDAVIRAPYMTQWLGLPYYIAMPAITTAAGGRTFVAMGHIAHHRREEPWLNTILARNGYNGAELWRRRLPDGYLVHRSAFVAMDDAFFMIDPNGGGCLVLDPETGSEKDRVRIPEAPGEWKWIAISDGVLYALAGASPDPAETTLVRSENGHWSWGELSKGYYAPRVPWGFGTVILAYDLGGKRLLWRHEEASPVDSRAMVMGNGHIYLLAPEARVACLDAATGREVWSNPDAEVRELIEEPGLGLCSTPGFKTTCLCTFTPKALFYQGQTRMNVVALSLEDGSLLWQREKTTNNPNVIYLDGRILVGIGPEGDTLVLDPETGETIENLGFRKRSCVRLTATPDSIFCRGWFEGVTRYDRSTGKITFDGALRPACNDGVIGANGLLYVGPWLCDCNLSLMGTAALCSAEHGRPLPKRLEVPGNGEPVRGGEEPVSEADWPMHRGNAAHSAGTAVEVSPPLTTLWTWAPPMPGVLTPPVAAGGLVFLGGEDGYVRAVDAATGELRWAYATGGPILAAPTVWGGRAYVGSGDGYLYAIEAATGKPAWRFHVAPKERRIMVYGRLCSTWPVNSGVVVADGLVLCAAGIVDYDGTYVAALDAETGRLVWENATSGNLDKSIGKGISAQGYMTIADGQLWMAGGNVISPASYDLSSGKYRGPAPLDGSPQSNRGEEIGLFRDRYLICGGRLRYSATSDVVNPGFFTIGRPGGEQVTLAQGRTVPAWDEELLVVVPKRGASPVAYEAAAVAAGLDSGAGLPVQKWRSGVFPDSQAQAVVVTKTSVVVACKMEVPGNLEPRWCLYLADRQNGTGLCHHWLPSAVLENGLAVDRAGRILVAMENGALICFGGQAAFKDYLAGLLESVTEEGGSPGAVLKILQSLARVHDPVSRALLIEALERAGQDPFAEAREAGSVRRWWLLGPVAWDYHRQPLDADLIGEPKVRLDGPCTVGGRNLAWRAYPTIHPKGMVDLAAIHGPQDWHAIYAYAEVELPEEADLLLQVGTNDGFKCWFNGQEAGRFEGGRVYRPDEDVLPVRGHQGLNTILLKVAQEGGGWALGVRITDREGRPVVFNQPAP